MFGDMVGRRYQCHRRRRHRQDLQRDLRSMMIGKLRPLPVETKANALSFESAT